MNRSRKTLALTATGLTIASTAAVVDAGLAPPASAHHADYCGHGIGPESYHDGIRYRSKWISSRDTVGPHIHKYMVQRFWNLAWYDQHTYEMTCTH
jgi:hypothetical protein